MAKQWPEVKPRKLTEEDKASAEEQRIANELAEDRILAGVGPDVHVEMTEGQRTAAEVEKAALLEAVKPVPVKAGPEAQDGRAQRQEPIRRESSASRVAVKATPTPAVDPAAVAERLAAATSEVRANEAKIEAAEKAELDAKVVREAELEESKRLLGLAQEEERRLTEARTSQELQGRASLYEREGARNRVTASTSAQDVRAQFTMQAAPLLQRALVYLADVEGFLEEHKAALTKLAKSTWENAPGEWLPIHRVQFQEAASRPAGTLLSELSDAYNGGVELVRQIDEVMAGRGEPSAHLLERLRMVAGRTMDNYVSRLGVINTAIRRVEERALAHVRPGVRPDVELRVTPYSPPLATHDVATGWDPHGPSRQ